MFEAVGADGVLAVEEVGLGVDGVEPLLALYAFELVEVVEVHE